MVEWKVYPPPRLQDMIAKLAGGKKFSNIGLRPAYLQLPLDAARKDFTTFNTSQGLFRYNCLLFGISSAPAIFHRPIEEILGHVQHTGIRVDDILGVVKMMMIIWPIWNKFPATSRKRPDGQACQVLLHSARNGL